METGTCATTPWPGAMQPGSGRDSHFYWATHSPNNSLKAAHMFIQTRSKMHLEHMPGTIEKKNIKCHSLCLPFFAVPVTLFPQN